MKKVTIDSFLNKLIAQRGYSEATQDIKDELHKDLKTKLDEFIVTRTVAEFSEKDFDTFDKLLDENKSPEELTQFAKEHILDYQTFITSTLLQFQDAFLL
jgi:ribosomal protein S24E